MQLLGIEYDPEPPFDTGSPEKAPACIRDALKKRMLAHFLLFGDRGYVSADLVAKLRKTGYN